jgi:phosphocarrier protein HPr
MVSKKVVVRNKSGLHARPASNFVKESQRYQSTIMVAYMEKEFNAKSILGILGACIKCGMEIELRASGLSGHCDCACAAV